MFHDKNFMPQVKQGTVPKIWQKSFLLKTPHQGSLKPNMFAKKTT